MLISSSPNSVTPALYNEADPARATHHRKWKVLIVEDQPLMRYGLVRVIDAEPDMVHVGQADNAATALELLSKCDPDIVIVDLFLGRDDGLELLKQLVSRRPHLPILVFSFMDEALVAERVLRAGARGYLMKDATGEVILAALRGVLHGEIRVSKAISDAALGRLVGRVSGQGGDPLAQLTDRELQLFLLFGKGHDTHQIADELFISVHTVQAHREHIKAKLKFARYKDLERYAAQFVTSTS